MKALITGCLHMSGGRCGGTACKALFPSSTTASSGRSDMPSALERNSEPAACKISRSLSFSSSLIRLLWSVTIEIYLFNALSWQHETSRLFAVFRLPLSSLIKHVSLQVRRECNLRVSKIPTDLASHCVDGVSSCDLYARSWRCCLFCRINGEIEVERSWEYGRNVAH